MMRSILSELKTLFWLQWKLTLSMFRSRRTADRIQIGRWLLLILQFGVTFPMFVVMGGALAVGMILLSPQAAYELAIVVNAFVLIIWLFLPASYSSQFVERFEMSRLFVYPMSFRAIVVGSTLISALSLTGLWTIPLVLGEVIGFAWHMPLALPLILLGTLPTFILLVLIGRIMDDLFDLVASDRRLRALGFTLLSLPFILLWLGQYYLQYVTNNFEELPDFLNTPLTAELAEAEGLAEFLEILRPSRFLIWLPPGWTTAGMGLVTTGAWLQGLIFLGLSLLAIGGLLLLHANVTRRLMQGASLRLGAERVRTQDLGFDFPGPTNFWALFRKDWLYFRRSPMPRRLLFSAVVVIFVVGFSLIQIPASEFPKVVRQALPMVAAAFLMVMLGMTVNMAISSNYFGTIDREGWGTLTLMPLDRRLFIVSNNLATLIYVMVLYFFMLVVLTVLSGDLIVLPLGLFAGLCLQISSAPAYTFASVIGPYRTQLKSMSHQRTGNLWGMLAWVISTPPVIVLILLPYLLWKPGLIISLPLAAVYSMGLYLLTLKPLAKALRRREYRILQAVTRD